MSIYVGNYVEANDSNASYVRQKGEIQQAIQTYGADNMLGVIVGNEFVLECVCLLVACTDPRLTGLVQLGH
jgi:hypothetical protein